MKDNRPFVLLLTLFGALVFLTVAYRYYDYVIRHDFVMDVMAPCDSAHESCFVSSCSSQEDPGCPVGPYKKVEIRASDAPICLAEHQCRSFTCDGIASCTVTYCENDALEDGESCKP